MCIRFLIFIFSTVLRCRSQKMKELCRTHFILYSHSICNYSRPRTHSHSVQQTARTQATLCSFCSNAKMMIFGFNSSGFGLTQQRARQPSPIDDDDDEGMNGCVVWMRMMYIPSAKFPCRCALFVRTFVKVNRRHAKITLRMDGECQVSGGLVLHRLCTTCTTTMWLWPDELVAVAAVQYLL